MTDFTRFQTQDNSSAATKEDLQAFEGGSGEEQLKEFEAAIERLKVLSINRKEPFDDDVLEVLRLCRSLESILRHQQKEKLTFWSERRDYFHYLTEGSDLKELENLVKHINQNSTELASAQGKGRALIRLCLSHQLLADCIQSAVSSTKKTKDWYNPPAILLNPVHSDRLVNALYDLSGLKFKLPVIGVNLEEAWPSFVQKSFVSTSSNSPLQNNKQRSYQTRTGQSTNSHLVQDPSFKLETAVEEKPSEVFVRQEIPFDIKLVATLFTELRGILTDEFEGYTQDSVLPEITVTKLDDITSGLSLLKDYIIAMSEDMTDSSHRSHEVIKQLRTDLVDVKQQLRSTQQTANGHQAQLKSALKMVDSAKKENDTLKQQIEDQEEQITSLRTLQEQMTITEEHQKDRELLEEAQSKVKLVQLELTEQTSSLTELQREKQALEEDSKANRETCNILREELTKAKAEIERISNESSQEKEHLTQKIDEAVSEKNKLSDRLSQDLAAIKESYEKEILLLTEQASLHRRRHEESEQEKVSIKEELREVQGLVEQETASLRFQLSTNNMQLQQALEARSNHEKESIELKQHLRDKTQELLKVSSQCDRQNKEISHLKEQLMISETATKSLQDDLTSLNIQLTENTLNRDTIREESLKVQRECDDLKERMLTDTQKLSQQAAALSKENEDLRKAVQTLLQQKVNLWQHADDLEQEQVSKGTWIDSKLVTHCMDCQAVFNLFNRKHHCRSCGKVFCTPCCENKIQLPSSRAKERVCRLCFNRISSLRTPHAAVLVNTLGKEDDDQQSRSNTLTSSSEPINAFPGGVSMSDSNLVQLTPLDGSDESLLQHIKELVSTPRNASKRDSLNNSNNYSIDPLATTNTFSPHSDGGSIDPDDEFCVIDLDNNNKSTVVSSTNENSLDVLTLQAKLATLESSSNESSNNNSLTPAAAISPMDDDIQEETDLHIDGGGMHIVRVKVDTPRTVVSWQFNSEPRGIAMGLNYQEEEGEHSISILPEKRVMSHKTILVGEYVAQKAGIYTLVFNNSHSKYSGRLLNYKVWKKYQS